MTVHRSSLRARAEELDSIDPLRGFRDRFVIDEGLVYLDGNSLGRLPTVAIDAVRDIVEREWATELVTGWEHWIDQGAIVGDRLAPLIGASEGEVVLCDQTSVNLYKVASAALTTSGRADIVTDRGNFPSDRYVLDGVARAHGGRLIFVREDPSEDEIARAVTDTVGVLSFSHVAYRSGTMLDGVSVTKIAHDGGAFMLWDLAHSAGSVPVALNQWNADAAVGCTYKYLNGGPGAPGYLYVRKDLQTHFEQPIPGWFSHADQFAMSHDYVPSPTIQRFVVGTPPMISLVAAEAGIDVTGEAGIDAIRAKSILLTTMFIDGIDGLGGLELPIVTPKEARLRGSHVTLAHDNAFQISQALRAHRVIPDFREPNLIRFGFAPLYTTFTEVALAIDVIREVIDSREYLAFPTARRTVT